MERFREFIESEGNASTAAVPIAADTNKNMGATQVWNSRDQQQFAPGQADPEISNAAKGLSASYHQLRDIFAKVRERMNTFRSPQMKSAFEKNLITSIDGVGRAHALILPAATGDDGSEQL